MQDSLTKSEKFNECPNETDRYPGSPRPNKVAGLWDDSCKGFLTTNRQSLVDLDFLGIYTPWKFNIAPEKRWLEDYFPIGKVNFQGRTVKLRGGIYIYI